jgi:hypothetical protein
MPWLRAHCWGWSVQHLGLSPTLTAPLPPHRSVTQPGPGFLLATLCPRPDWPHPLPAAHIHPAPSPPLPQPPRLQRLHLRLRPDRQRQDTHHERHRCAATRGAGPELQSIGGPLLYPRRAVQRGGNFTACGSQALKLTSLHPKPSNSTPPHPTPPHPTPLHPRQMEYRITVQMLEIYNESLRDLLADGCASGTRLEILSTRASGCNVPGAVQVRGSGRAGGFWQPLGSCVSALRGAAWCPAPKARLKLLLLAVMNPGSARLALATCATLTLACHHPYPSPPPQRALDPLAHTLTQVEVDNAHDVARIMACGAANRATSETKMNDRSSRRCAGRRARVDAAQEHR